MSGFDPEVDEILEIGFVFFTIDENGAHITEEWSKVFRPTQPVHPKILGLTGITQIELEQAPLISEYKEFLQEKLGDVIILGHSIKVDIAFLENAGLVLNGGSIDTLELAQFILPTHHSYNLENLIHTFSIVSTESHRALADAKATMSLLEKLLGMYQGFPQEVRVQIEALTSEQPLLWKELLPLAVPTVALVSKSPINAVTSEAIDLSFAENLQSHSIVTVPLAVMQPAVLAQALQKSQKKYVWVVSDKQTAIMCWKSGYAQALLPAEDYFDNDRFEALLLRTDLTLEEIRFILKILVWRATNWQSYSLVDLNISFFGGQFRHLVSASEVPVLPESLLYVTDFETFLHSEFADQKSYTVIFERMTDLERTVSRSLAKKASWGYAAFALRSIYNPETNLGDPRLQGKVLDLLARVDLFFGIAQLQLQAITHLFGFVTDEQLLNHDYEYGRIEIAAENLIEKLEELNIEAHHHHLRDFVINLREFFHPTELESVRYIEFREGYVGFITQPLRIDTAVAKVLEPFDGKAVFIDSKSSDIVERYFVKRLGIEQYSRVYHEQTEGSQVSLSVYTKELALHELFDSITIDVLPLVVSLPSLAEIKEFYRQYHEELNKLGVVYAQGYSGGTNKIVRNFGIRPHSILIVTHEFLAQAPLRALFPKRLIVGNFGVGNGNHPYTQALERYYGAELGTNLATIRSLLTLEGLLKRVYHENLEKIEFYTVAEDAPLFMSFIEGSGLYTVTS